ncbi:hypothetical protein TNCT_675761 [Trichonephila clavata]|uniref:Uncharacterized protein n=1 Tax=Trichonephila clavata TaxID=2740835 RepID=A0A8X6FTY8_TRICU|nr:hypothetical protein TNCT_675761 [Trichonephila clavata]
MLSKTAELQWKFPFYTWTDDSQANFLTSTSFESEFEDTFSVICNQQCFQRLWNFNGNSPTICGLMTHKQIFSLRHPLKVNSRIRSRLYVIDNVVNDCGTLQQRNQEIKNTFW